MIIDSIKLTNFRNISEANVKPCSKINFIIGNNAQGKTNFIEALYTAALLKSFRTRNISDLVKENENYSNIEISVINSSVTNKINIKLVKSITELKINNKKPERNNLFSYLNTIVFHPDEVNYITSYPLFRRNLLDRSIFYTNYNYIDTYRNYLRCLKQRNAYLKENLNFEDCWQEQLIIYGAEIIRERLSYIKKINNYFSGKLFSKENNENYTLHYSKNFLNIETIEEELAEEFKRKKNRERSVGYTLTGPHKDDIIFYLNGQQADKFASQGQKRSLVISYKTAQILDYQAVHGYLPVLILDDMTSELDANRKNILLENLLVNSGQVFITSTDFKQINCSENSRVFKVNDGYVSLAD